MTPKEQAELFKDAKMLNRRRSIEIEGLDVELVPISRKAEMLKEPSKSMGENKWWFFGIGIFIGFLFGLWVGRWILPQMVR